MAVDVSVTLDGNGQPITAANPMPVGGTVDVLGTVAVNGGTVEIGNFPSTQPVSGTVSVAGIVAVVDIAGEASLATIATQTTDAAEGIGTSSDAAWGGSGVSTVIAALKALYGVLKGTLTATLTGALPAGSNALGSVSVSNLPGTQPVSGSVAVTNLPGTQTVAGAVSISGTAAVAGTVGISSGTIAVNGGTLSIGNLPGTQAVAGTVSIVSADTVAVAGTITPLDGLIFVGTATGTGVVTYSSPGPSSGIIDTQGYAAVSVQVTSVAVGVTAVFQISNDGTNWAMAEAVVDSNGSATTSASTGNGLVCYVVSKLARYFRLNVSAYTSGTFGVSAALLSVNPGILIAAQTSTYTVNIVPSTSNGGGSTARIQSAATTNATSVKTASGNIYSLDVGNSGTIDAWFKIYNKASSPTVGTDTPLWTVYIPNGTARLIPLDTPVFCSTGIAYAITGGAADTDTTAVALNQVTGILNYR